MKDSVASKKESSSESLLEGGVKDKLRRQKRWISFMFPKEVPVLPTQEERKVYPEKHSNFIKRMFFWWLLPLFTVGYLRTIQPEDLFILDEHQQMKNMYELFQYHFKQEVKRKQEKHILSKVKSRNETLQTSSVSASEDLEDFVLSRLTLILVVFKCFYYDIIKSIILTLFASGITVSIPLLQKGLVEFIESRTKDPNSKIGKGIGFAIGLTMFLLVNGIMTNVSQYTFQVVGGQFVSLLTKEILRKALYLTPKSHHKFDDGKISSIISTDLNRIVFASRVMLFALVIPINLVVSIALLIYNIGVASLVGVAVYGVFSIGIGSLFTILVQYRKNITVYTDKRVTLIKEVLKNFRMIKYFRWEVPYFERLKSYRENESKAVLKLTLVRNILASSQTALPAIATMSAICVMYGIHYYASIGSIFASVSWLDGLGFSFTLLPMAVSTSADAAISLKRVCELLSADEIEEINDSSLSKRITYNSKEKGDENIIEIKNGYFEWDTFGIEDKTEASDNGKDKKSGKKENKEKPKKEIIINEKLSEKDEEESMKKLFPGLNNINLSIKRNEFVVVTGSIGSGKTSLLNAFAGFMKKQLGEVTVNGSMILCGAPWIQNSTIRDNILFGSSYDQSRYDDIVRGCSLKNDFKQLPGGDLTQVGESGITLSGGQKSRISLARAIYADADIILMDDVLSAVDAKVGKHIVDNCILEYLSDKTRILATHQLSLIGSADRIIFLNGDGTIDVGKLDELRTTNEAFAKLLPLSNVVNNQPASQVGTSTIKIITSTTEKPTVEVKIVEEENRAVNRLKGDVISTYVKLASGFFRMLYLPILLFVVALYQFNVIFATTWLSFWVSKKFTHLGDPVYIGLYIMFTFLVAVFGILFLCQISYGVVLASKKLNILALKRIMHVPLSYTDITPMGRILNRFTKDTDALDNEIVEVIQNLVQDLSSIIGTIILCVIYIPWFAISIPFLISSFTLLTDYFQSTSREVKRLEALERSNVYSHFNETLSGRSTIKIYKSEERFLNEIDAHIDSLNEPFFLTIANQKFLVVNMTLLVSFITLLVSLLCCFRVFKINSASTGLLLTYILQISQSLVFVFTFIAQLENEMNSVERLKHFAFDLPQEAPFDIPELDPKPEWPEFGAIKFQNVSLKYRSGLPYVLKNVSMNISPSENIGVCGRTGAGKSTLMTCIFRMAEPEGIITIDDVDIKNLGLGKLRSKLSIIPQEPVLFAGTIRENLDPFHERSEDELWDTLKRSHLIEESVLERVKVQTVRDESMHKFHLQQIIEEDGSNLSLGERQLLALARTLVRKSKILILDEATSSVDYETDDKIQKTIAAEFHDSTILCIAHRLKTILDYDKILVMDDGKIAEFDTPWNLFQNTSGIFRSMCDQSNIIADNFNRKC